MKNNTPERKPSGTASEGSDHLTRGIPLCQEWLKGIACAAMLIDHIGAVFVQGYTLRIIGRLAFPVFCFLLAEGAERTRNPGKYALRLALGAIVSEIPYDLLFYGGFDWAHQNVMLTLLIGLLTIRAMRRWPRFALVPLAVGCLLAEAGNASYGGWGVALIVLFAWTAHSPRAGLLRFAGMTVIFLCMNSAVLPGVGIPIQLLGIAAWIPIGQYSGRKATNHPAVQWGFYLFYPLHLLVLLWLRYALG